MDKCIICGKTGEMKYTNNTCSDECFDVDFWNEKVGIKDLPTTVRVGGDHYIIAPNRGYRGFVGHGGAEFKIKFHDGREVITRNLWHQGTIPESYRGILPDNAVFITNSGVEEVEI